jgi:hypothetical protein
MMNDDLDRELQELGPLMAEQARLETEGPDPAFATELRARLVGQAAARQRGTVEAPASKRRSFRLPRWSLGLSGLGAAVAVAAVVLLLLLSRGKNPASPEGQKTAYFVPPTPSGQDITKSYPPIGQFGGGGGPVPPTHSRIESIPGSPYPRTLRLTAGALPRTPATVRAYRLQDASAIAARVKQLARALGIHGPVQRTKDYDLTRVQVPNVAPPMVTWLVVRQGSATTERSIAISTLTGAVIYHDLSADTAQNGNRFGPPHAEALSLVRSWLAHLGWPGDTMPEGPPVSGPVFGATRITLSWPGVPSVDRSAAEVWVVPGGHVDEALVLPPVQDATNIKPRSIGDAWKLVRTGKAPVGVANSGVVDPRHGPGGTGSLTSVSTEQVVTFTRSGRIYLVPAYRFTGTVTLQGVPGTKTWIALVPAT